MIRACIGACVAVALLSGSTRAAETRAVDVVPAVECIAIALPAVEGMPGNAVDVASGVEKEKGKKDHTKLKAFVKAVREADKRVS